MTTRDIAAFFTSHTKIHLCQAALVVGALMASPPTTVRGANWYVDNAATGANQGTSWTDAWASFQAISWALVQPGDTIYISGGPVSQTYSEVWKVGKSGAPGAAITFAIDSGNSAHNGVVLFDYAGSGASAGVAVDGSSASYITWTGNVAGQRHFVFQNIVNTSSGPDGTAIAAQGSTGWTIDSVAFTNVNNGIWLASSTKFTVRNCQFRLVHGTAAVDALGCFGSSWDDNLVQNNDFQVVRASDGSAPTAVEGTDDLTIANNVFSTLDQASGGLGGSGNYCEAQGSFVKIVSNEFISGSHAAIGLNWTQNSAPHDLWIYDNLFRFTGTSDATPEGITCVGGALSSLNNLKVLNNTFLDVPWPCLSAPPLGTPTATGIEIKNNLFYNCGNGSASPVLNFAVTSAAVFDANLYFHPSNLSYVASVNGTYPAGQWVSLFEPHGSTNQPVLLNYTPLAATNDGRLSFRDLAARDRGLDLSAYFATDKLGQIRPQGPAWDIGAVEATIPLLHAPVNGRYFLDPAGNPLFLTGMHTWFVLQDYVNQSPFDYAGYLNTMAANNHNCLRLWQNDAINDGTAPMTPLPYLRTGPGTATLGGLKFDLSQYDPAFFDRLSNRVAQAAAKNIYISMMLFEGWPIYGQGSTYLPWNYYYFSNNVHGIITSLSQQFTLSPAGMVSLNDGYVRKVVDTLNGFDNVIYEIVNEPPVYTSDWQNHLVNLIKSYEATKPKQHPVGMSAFWPNSTGSQGNTVLLQSASDWISPYGGGQGNEPDSSAYRTNPPALLNPTKVEFLDTDHLQGFGPGQRLLWAWKAFCRGYNLLYMDSYDGTTQWDVVRAMGTANSYSTRMNLAGLTPSTTVSSTTYALVNPGNEYLVFQPTSASFTVNLVANTYTYEWLNPPTSLVGGTGTLQSSGGVTIFNVPAGFTNAVLYLKAQPVVCPTLALVPVAGPLPGAVEGTPYSATLSGSGGQTPYAFSISNGALPGGVVLSAAGLLSGTPVAPGTFNFSVKVIDANGCPGSSSYSLTVNCPTVAIAPGTLASGVAGIAYSQTLTASGGTGSYSFSGTSLPTWLSLTTGGVLSGTPPTPGTFTFSVKVLDANGCPGTAGLALTVNCPTVTILPGTLASGVAGIAYSQALTASGGTGSYSFSGTSLPAWLSLTTAGVLSGTPPTPGTFTFSVKATDANGCPGTGALALTVNCPTVTIAPGTLASGVAGVAYSQTLTASGGTGPYNFSGTSLPNWLSLTTDGALSGTAPASGTWTVSVKATDANGCVGSRSYSFVANCPTITVAPAQLAGGTTTSLYSQTLTASGGTGPYTFTGTSLPAWLTLTSGGFLSGTPPASGTYSFSVKATDVTGCTASLSYSLGINCPTVTVGPASLASAVAGNAYSQTLTGNGGAAPYSFSGTSLPAWLTITTAGVLSGTPSASGTLTVAVKATDANGCSGTASYTLTVNCPTVTVGPASLASAVAGKPYSQTLTGSGGTAPYSFSGASLPAWLTLTAAGVLSGTPPASGTLAVAVRATDADGCSGTASYILTVNCPTVTVGPASLASAVAGKPYNQTLTGSGGTAPYSFSGTSLPAWLTLTSAGVLSGTPPATGTFSFSVSERDALGCSGTRTLSLTVKKH